MKLLIYFVNFCQPIKYVFVRLWLVCLDSTAHHEPQDNKHCYFCCLLFQTVIFLKPPFLHAVEF